MCNTSTNEFIQNSPLQYVIGPGISLKASRSLGFVTLCYPSGWLLWEKLQTVRLVQEVLGFKKHRPSNETTLDNFQVIYARRRRRKF